MGVQTGLALLVLLDAVQVDIEQVGRVKGTALGLGVELGAENGARLVDHTLVALVIQVHEVRLPLRGQGGGINGVTVVLAGDVAATSAQIQSRDVVGPVTVLELDGASTGGESKQLVTQADTEDGDLGSLHQSLQVEDGVLAVSGVTGAVGDEDTIEVVGDLVDGVIKGEDSDASATVHQTTQDVLLHTAVEDGNVRVRVSSANVERLLGADLTDQVNLFRVGEGLVLVGIVLLADCDLSQRRTPLTEEGDNSTSVNPRDGRNTFPRTPLTQALNGSPVAVLLSNISDDYTGRLQVGGLEVLEKPVRVLLGRRYAIVADQRLSENQDLAAVGWIGQGLGVPDQGGGEDRLTGNVGASAKGLAGEHGAVTDGEGGGLHRGTLTNGGHEASLGLHGGEGLSPGGHGLEQIHDHFDLRDC